MFIKITPLRHEHLENFTKLIFKWTWLYAISVKFGVSFLFKQLAFIYLLFIYIFTGCLDLRYLFIYLFTGCLDLCYLLIYLPAARISVIYLFIYLFPGCLDLRYLFIFLFTGCSDLRCSTWLLLLLWVLEPPGSQAEAHRLSCPLPRGIRALPPGTEPPSPALEGWFSMTAPPGKAPRTLVFIPVFCYVYGWINGQTGRYINSCVNA